MTEHGVSTIRTQVACLGGPPLTLDAVDDRAMMTQARSMLILLLAACKQTQTALEAAANVLDSDLTRDLGVMIERTERELEELTSKLEASA